MLMNTSQNTSSWFEIIISFGLFFAYFLPVTVRLTRLGYEIPIIFMYCLEIIPKSYISVYFYNKMLSCKRISSFLAYFIAMVILIPCFSYLTTFFVAFICEK
jgi:hypothetical protein